MNVVDLIAGIDAPNGTWDHYKVWRNIRSSMGTIRDEFKSAISVSGVPACDLHTWGSVLSAAVEIEVVRCLNKARNIWDGDGGYAGYSFRRQAARSPTLCFHAGTGAMTSYWE